MENKTTEYRQHIELWMNSGKSKIDYCRENSLSYQTFFYHFKRVKRAIKPKKFVQVQIRENVKDSTEGKIELYLANGSCLVFSQSITPAFIRQVVFGC